MADKRGVKLHVELEVEVDDAEKLAAYVRRWVTENLEEDEPSESFSQIQEGVAPALQLIVDPDNLVDDIPGVFATGASWWAEEVPVPTETVSVVPTRGVSQETPRSEDEILQLIVESANRVPGIELERLGYDESESDPDQRAQSLTEATALAGAIAWACNTLVDELFDDVFTLRDSGSIRETWQINNLPPLYRARYDALFAQKFLTVAVDLGTSFIAGFRSPTCVAQELALKFVLDGVEVLRDLYPRLPLARDWRSWTEDSLFEDLDYETLFDASLDGVSTDPNYAHLGMANLDFSSWFVPFTGRVVPLYGSEEERTSDLDS